MRLEVLGCSGGIGGRQSLTTALRVDDDILIDCGTGVGSLSANALARIDHIFLTHSHLDHIALLPMLLDSVSETREHPVTLYGASQTLTALRRHVFNWTIWPDFTALPRAAAPMLRLVALQAGQSVAVGARRVTAIPAEHSVPALGYVVSHEAGSFAFSGDTTLCEAQLDALNAVPDLRLLIIETAFPQDHSEMARMSRHLSPASLHRALATLTGRPVVRVTHLKPAHAGRLAQEIMSYPGPLDLALLEQGEVFEFE